MTMAGSLESAARPTSSSSWSRGTTSTKESSPRRLRVLTVGDGDLSLSLSLARCFGRRYLDLTATTLLESAEALYSTYPATAESNLCELRQVHSVPVLFGVNACFLHTNPALLEKSSWDVISFHHPHLGCDSHWDNRNTDSDELDLLQRHTSLLAHYLHSAAQLLSTTTCHSGAHSIVHVALCANQAESWKLRPAVERLGLELVLDQGLPVQRPFYQIFPHLPSLSTAATATKKQRRTISKRHGGSRHWLGKFGYRHVRTVPTTMCAGTTAPNLTGSRHYTIRKRPVDAGAPMAPIATSFTQMENGTYGDGDASVRWECPICRVPLATRSELEEHWNDPASPKLFKNTTLLVDRNDRTSVMPAGNSPSSDRTKPSTTSTVHGFKLVEILESNPEGRDTTVILQATKAIAGKRLRWCLQHLLHQCVMPNKVQRCIQSFSNSDWNRFIKEGGVSVNGALAMDTGRILQEGWTIELKLPLNSRSLNVYTTVFAKADGCSSNGNNAPGLLVVGKWSPSFSSENTIFVVWKPVGMRAIGSFDTGTLEETFSRQQQEQQLSHPQQPLKFGNHGQHSPVALKYTSFSRLDTGCSGLCVLAPTGVWKEYDVKIIHTFTALVHGHVRMNGRLVYR
jgi:Domain of unknown function (DUF2431)